MKPWIQLSNGTPFDLLDPKISPADVGALVHALCRIVRFNGHTLGKRGYTVGHHSLIVADLLRSWGAPLNIEREGLLHDLPEAIYGDMVSPVQAALSELGGGEAWRELRSRVDRAVFGAVGVSEERSPLVKRADLVALAIERRDLMALCVRDWELPEFAPWQWPRIDPRVDAPEVQQVMLDRLAMLDKGLGLTPWQEALTP